MSINIVLLEPEIPQNTGNIARTCVITNSVLHIIRPTGFEISDRTVKRAGLDYWEHLKIVFYDNFDEFLDKNKDANIYFLTTKAKKNYCDVALKDNDFFVFGKESKGIPEDILLKNFEKCIRIPMYDNMRSLNLSNSVAIVLYEALRQTNFDGLKIKSDYFGQ